MTKTPLASPHIETLEPYLSARRIGGDGEVWLNANESPFPRDAAALDPGEYHRYPDTGPDALARAYAHYGGVAQTQVLALRGADEVIDLLVRAYCRAARDRILICGPTYGMYAVCAQIQDAGVIDVPLTRDFRLDVDAICARDDVRLVFLCNPNNPTGQRFAQRDLLAVIEHFEGRALVVVDEAYIEFCPEASLLAHIERYEHLALARTMSKAFGLAGVHVGFLVAPESLVSIVRKVAAPYPLADPCAQIALQALSAGGIARMRGEVELIGKLRDQVASTLSGLSCVNAVLDSDTNFLLASLRDVDRAWAALVDDGIVARRIPHPRLRDAIRFSIGTPAEMDRVIACLRRLDAAH